LGLFFSRVLPYWLWQKCNPIVAKPTAPVKILIEENTNNDSLVLKLSGDCHYPAIQTISSTFKVLAQSQKNVTIDLAEVTFVDGAFLDNA